MTCQGHATETRIAELEDALRTALHWLERAPISYSNGVTHNGIDEGDVRGWEGHNAVVQELHRALGIDDV